MSLKLAGITYRKNKMSVIAAIFMMISSSFGSGYYQMAPYFRVNIAFSVFMLLFNGAATYISCEMYSKICLVTRLG